MLGMENEGGSNFPFRYIGWERVSLTVARPPPSLSLIYCPVDMRQPASLPSPDVYIRVHLDWGEVQAYLSVFGRLSYNGAKYLNGAKHLAYNS